jgi:hypothetical protein
MEKSMFRLLLLNITNKNSNYGRQDLAKLWFFGSMINLVGFFVIISFINNIEYSVTGFFWLLSVASGGALVNGLRICKFPSKIIFLAALSMLLIVWLMGQVHLGFPSI